MSHENLSHKFLIAMPQLEDSIFGGALVYICRHEEEDGALGVMTNQPLEISLSEIFEQLEFEDERPQPALQTVVSGGPVEADKGFILHDGAGDWNSSVELEDGLTLTTSRDILRDIAANRGPEHFLIALGCAGWAPGQLEQEIMDNAWLVCPADQSILFSRDYGNMTNLVTGKMGFDMAQLTSTAGYS